LVSNLGLEGVRLALLLPIDGLYLVAEVPPLDFDLAYSLILLNVVAILLSMPYGSSFKSAALLGE